MLRPNMTYQNGATMREREPKICLQELMYIVMHGIYPSEQRLEYLLDRLEGST